MDADARSFDATPIPGPALAAQQGHAARFGIEVRFLVDEGWKRRIAGRVAEGDRMPGRRSAFRRELADRFHDDDRRPRDGVPGYAHGLGASASAVGPFVACDLDWGR